MKLNNKIYDVGKWIVLIFLPALAVLMNGLGELYGWGNAQTIVATINLITIFLGSLLQISSNKYNKNIEQSGGEIDERRCS